MSDKDLRAQIEAKAKEAIDNYLDMGCFQYPERMRAPLIEGYIFGYHAALKDPASAEGGERDEAEALREEIERYNARVAKVPSLPQRPRNVVEGLRFLATWFDALYPDDPDTQVQDDLRRWADELEPAPQPHAEREALEQRRADFIAGFMDCVGLSFDNRIQAQYRAESHARRHFPAAPPSPREVRYVCDGCGREGPFDSYEIERDPLSGVVQHWDEKNQAWCGPVREVKPTTATVGVVGECAACGHVHMIGAKCPVRPEGEKP